VSACLPSTCRPIRPASFAASSVASASTYGRFALIRGERPRRQSGAPSRDELPPNKILSMHWSGCPAGCGNHLAADTGLLGKNVRIDGQIGEAVDGFVGGTSGRGARPSIKILEDVPCDDLPHVLERVIPYLSGKKHDIRTSQPTQVSDGRRRRRRG
jgi:sulfite reductase beta subunit-like hemoprotein